MKSLKIFSVLLIAGALVASTALPASAAEFDPVVPIAPSAEFPQISVDPASGHGLVVWQDQNSDAIYGQIVDPDLAVVLPKAEISTADEQVDRSQPYAAWNPASRNWLVVWYNQTQIWGALFDSAGPVGTPNVLADRVIDEDGATFGDIEQVEVAWSTVSGVYLVGFKAASVPDDCEEIFGVLVDANGVGRTSGAASVISSDDAVEDCDVTADDGVRLAYSPAVDQWFVSWFGPGGSHQVGRFVGADPQVPTHESGVLDLGANVGSDAGAVAYDPVGGRFLVVWYTTTDGGSQLVGNYVRNDQTVGSRFAITDNSHDAHGPQLAYDAATASFLVVAHGALADAGSPEIWLWRLPAGSTAEVTDAQQVSEGGDTSTRPDVAFVKGCTIVVWQLGPEARAVTGRSSCTAPATAADPAPVLPATGTDEAPLIGIALLALLLGFVGIGVARSRRATA